MPEIMPEQVATMLPIWHRRATNWRNQVTQLALDHRIPLSSVNHHFNPIAFDLADGVAFGENTITWFEKDYDGTLERMSAPYAVIRDDDAADVWIENWLTVELKRKNDQALLDRCARESALLKAEEAEKREFLRLKAKYEPESMVEEEEG